MACVHINKSALASGVSAAVLLIALGSPASAQTAPATQSVVAAPQTGAGNVSPVPGDSPQSAPTANANLAAGVPPGNDAGNVASTTPVLNQDRPTATDASPATGSDIVVTGSRLTNGMTTPTPVTVQTSSQLAQQAPNNIADGLARLPAFGGSVSTSAPVSSGTTGTVGQNLLNLRGLGDNRNLVLLDGRRVVSSNQDFAVDINTLPQNLIARVDVVTGGASAAYGSDAVAGVVNFVLDTKFTGVKGDVSAGISSYGDVPSRKIALAYGGDFLGGRLHIIAGENYFESNGVAANEVNPRAWFNRTTGLIPNIYSTTPTNLVLPNISSSVATTGGLIYTGPLKGTQFLENGVPAAFNYGYDSGSVFQSGGDGARANFGFTPREERSSSLVHANFDISSDVSAFAEFGYSYSSTDLDNSVQTLTGSTYSFTIFNDNAFLPASIKNTLAADKVTNFKLGRYMADFPDFHIINNNDVFREAIGFKGKNLFGKPTWNWDISYSGGQSTQYYAETNLSDLRKIYAASDAVVNPNTGQVVCRSQYYNSAGTFLPGGTGLDAGCVPLDVLGKNVSNPAAIAWIDGTSHKTLKTRQDVIEAKLSGDLGSFELGAGAISFALGGDYRHDSAVQTSDAQSQATIDETGVRAAPTALQGRLGLWRFGNFQPFTGSQSVKEGFLEVGIPILRDKRFASSLSADVAGRYTSYSLAGDVQTWKTGLDYVPVDGLRFRGTISRDIRAPNLLELFNTAIQNTNNVIYPSSSGGKTTQNLVVTTGNPNLKPEKALTQTYGMVLTPHGIPGLSLSVDYFHIKIKDAITTLTAQNEVDFCAAGQATYCSLVSYNATTNVVQVLIAPLNASELVVSGIDIEANYNREFLGHPIGLRVLANHSINNFSQAPNAAPLLVQGSASSPIWKGQLQLQYNLPTWGFFMNERFISAVKMDPNQVEGIYTNDNHVPAIVYFDVTLTKDVQVAGAKTQFYVTVENLLNQAPPIDVIPPTSVTNPTNNNYDRIGRYITAGIRFKF